MLKRAADVFGSSVVAMGVAGTVALLTGQPWLFPSLGPTVLVHAEQSDTPGASPRNTLIGHAVGFLAGYLMLVAFGLTGAQSALQTGVDGWRILAVAGSLAITGAVLILLNATHPPAAASTLLVSLGLLRTPTQLVIAMGAVGLVTIVDWIVARIAGRPMPVWRAESREES